MKKVFAEKDILAIYNTGCKSVVLAKGDVITPLAADTINSLGMEVCYSSEEAEEKNIPLSGSFIEGENKSVFIGSDKDGYSVKKILIPILAEKGFVVNDMGVYNEDVEDNISFAVSVAEKVSGKAVFGLLLDATGIKAAMTANKLKGIRAAACYSETSAKYARMYYNANILAIGAKTLGEETIKAILETWLVTEYTPGEYQKSIDEIASLERKQ